MTKFTKKYKVVEKDDRPRFEGARHIKGEEQKKLLCFINNR